MSTVNQATPLPARDHIRRILIMKWSALGDVVISTAAMEDVRRAFPDATLHINTFPAWTPLFRADPRFSKVIDIPVRNGASAMLAWLKTVRAGRYDLVVDLQSNDRARILQSLLLLSGARIPCRLGTHRRLPYNIAPPPQAPTVHAFDHLRAALQAGGIPTVTPRPVLHIPEQHRVRAEQLLKEQGVAGSRYAVFLPGCQAAGYLKRWGAPRYSALGLYLREAGYDRIVLLGARDEMAECQTIQQHCGDWVINLCGQTELLDIPPLCENAGCIVANDTGTAHIASATTTPMAVICGPTDPRRVKPVGEQIKALQAKIHCINCYNKHCSHHSCMMLVSPEAVFETLQGLGAV
ncbi:MAG TPA: glycosyltransferase family 9 protein [Gammaproteobacteria bacterium]|nr:glycosyltransferase family 9 protein [Gammaproteobacteria bacterium]